MTQGPNTPDPNPLRTIAWKADPKHHNDATFTDEQTIELKSPGEGRWQDKANCQGMGKDMFPKKHKDISYISKARKICKECEVKEECLIEALDYPTTDMHGVWAGLTPRQLLREQQKRNITPTKPTIAQIWNSLNKEDQ
jgi:hypothetical protein